MTKITATHAQMHTGIHTVIGDKYIHTPQNETQQIQNIHTHIYMLGVSI